MSEYSLACTVGGPGQTTAIALVRRIKQYGPRDPATWAPRVSQKLQVLVCERLPSGLKDSEVAGILDCWLVSYPYAGNVRAFIEHSGGREPVRRMAEKIQPWVHGVKVTQDSDGTPITPDGLRRVSQRELVSYLIPICQDAELQNPFAELTAQLLAADPNAAWREGDSDLASALFLAAWFSRGQSGGPRSTTLI